MKTIYEIVKRELELSPWSRERCNKNKFVARLLWKKWRIDEGRLHLGILEDMISDVSSYARMWQKVLQENPELRGKDYDTKFKVVQKKQLELGYESGFHDNIKKLETL